MEVHGTCTLRSGLGRRALENLGLLRNLVNVSALTIVKCEEEVSVSMAYRDLVPLHPGIGVDISAPTLVIGFVLEMPSSSKLAVLSFFS